MIKKSETNKWACSQSQDSIHEETPTKKLFKGKRWKGVQLCTGIWAGICSIAVWLGAGHEKPFDCQRTVAPLLAWSSWLTRLSSEGGIRADERGEDHSRGKVTWIQTKKRGEKRKGGGAWGQREKSLWYTLAEHLLSTGKNTPRREWMVPSSSWNQTALPRTCLNDSKHLPSPPVSCSGSWIYIGEYEKLMYFSLKHEHFNSN